MREVFPGADAVYQGQLILVNAGTPLRREPAEPLSAIRPGVQLENCSAEQLRKLLADVRAGSAITAVSGYRSHFEQTQIYENSVRENGADFTRQYVALPGCSEHQTGLAVDLGESRPQIDFIRPDFPDSVVCAALAGVGGAGVDRGTCWSVGTCRGDNRGGAYWNRDRPDTVFGAWCSDGLFSGGAACCRRFLRLCLCAFFRWQSALWTGWEE